MKRRFRADGSQEISSTGACLVANLAAKPIRKLFSEGMEFQGDFGIHPNAKVIVHHLMRRLDDNPPAGQI